MTDPSPEAVAVNFSVIREAGKVIDIQTDSPEIGHFLRRVKLTRAYNTWLNYANDLKVFFTIAGVAPASVGRPQCLRFIEHQDREGRSNATINRRLAAVSSLFIELNLLDPVRFPHNPVYPLQRKQHECRSNTSLYRKQPKRLPDVVAEKQLQRLFHHLRTWRDRTLILLMWLSCLRISEVVAIRFTDIECSHRQIRIREGKGGQARTAYMDAFTFEALNRYLDHERQNLSPDEDHIFVALKGPARGKSLSVNSVQKLLAYHVKTRNLSHIHPHLLRHTGITQLIAQGMSEPAVRAFVGHRHPASLQPYVHLNDAYVASEFNKAQSGLEFDKLWSLSSEGGYE